jgi:hypothetical protein
MTFYFNIYNIQQKIRPKSDLYKSVRIVRTELTNGAIVVVIEQTYLNCFIPLLLNIV